MVVILAGLLLTASACEKRSMSVPPSSALKLMAMDARPQQRYIAETHEIEIITPESELQKSWESVVSFCGTIQCEVTSSKIAARTGDSVPSGTISLRVAPQDLAKLLADLQQRGKIAQHTTERQDETAQVVDTDAKVKNLTTFRDNLRAMLTKPSATVKDLVEIQQQLTETQEQLDSETTRRKILANETEKVAVALSFHVEESRRHAGALAQIGDALSDSGSVLAESTASLITVVLAVVPWLVLIVPAIWVLARVWCRWRRKRTTSPPSTAAAL
jgi:hypothetical protein